MLVRLFQTSSFFDPLLTQIFSEGICTWTQPGEPGTHRGQGQERGGQDLAQAGLAVLEARGSKFTWQSALKSEVADASGTQYTADQPYQVSYPGYHSKPSCSGHTFLGVGSSP